MRESLLSWCNKSEHVQRGFPLTLFMQECDTILNRKKQTLDLYQHRVLRKTGSISDQTARNILRVLGWEHRKKKKGTYTDGSRRPDVDYHMHEVYIPGMKYFKQFMDTYQGGKDLVLIPAKPLPLRCLNVGGIRRGDRTRRSSRKQTDVDNSARETEHVIWKRKVEANIGKTPPGCTPYIPEDELNAAAEQYKKKKGMYPTKLVMIVQDECIFYSRDGNTKMWHREGANEISSKDNGRSLMLSMMMTAEGGALGYKLKDVIEAGVPVEDKEAPPRKEINEVKKLFAQKMSGVQPFIDSVTGEDPRVSFLRRAFEHELVLAGSSCSTLLGSGVEGLLKFLDEEKEGSEWPLHDIDLYQKGSTSLDFDAMVSGLGWNKAKSITRGNVTENCLTKEVDGKLVKLRVDIISNYSNGGNFALGTDLFGLSIFMKSKKGPKSGPDKAYYLDYAFLNNKTKPLAPNLHVTMQHAFNYGKGAPVDCYILRRDLVPSDDSTGAPGDRRHRAKLKERSDKGLITLKAAYPDCRTFYDSITRKLYVGAAWDGYFTGEDLIEQVRDSIPAFEAKHPGCIGVFVFDNATNHGTLPADALNVNWLNLNDGSDAKNRPAPSRKGWYFDDAGNKIEQEMNVMRNGELQRLGAKSVAGKRGYPHNFRKGKTNVAPEKPLLKCAQCKSKDGKQDWSRRNCCYSNFLMWQPDFMEQKSTVEEMIKEAGHICIFLPKFHPELNWIEMVWAFIKQRVRVKIALDPAPSMLKLEQYIREALGELHGEKQDTLKKYQRLADRYMHALELGATGKFLQFLIKKYKSHRSIPSDWEKDLDASFTEFIEKTGTVNDENAVNEFAGVRDTKCRQLLMKRLGGNKKKDEGLMDDVSLGFQTNVSSNVAVDTKVVEGADMQNEQDGASSSGTFVDDGDEDDMDRQKDIKSAEEGVTMLERWLNEENMDGRKVSGKSEDEEEESESEEDGAGEDEKKHEDEGEDEEEEEEEGTVHFDFTGEEEGKDDFDFTAEKQIRVDPTRLDDLQVIDLIEALQIDITGSDWKRENRNQLYSNPPVITHAVSADSLLNAMADRTQSDRGINQLHESSVDIDNTIDVALAIVNNASRVVLPVGGAESHEDMIGGLHWFIAAMIRKGKIVEMKLYDFLSSTGLSKPVLEGVRVPTKEEIDRHKKRLSYVLNISNALTPDWNATKIGAEALSWQTCNWKCAYYGVYVLLHALDSTKEDQEAWFTADGSRKLSQMPEGM